MGVVKRALGPEFKSLQFFLNRTAVLTQYRQFLRTTKPLASDVRGDVRRQIRAGFDAYRDLDDDKRVNLLLRQARDQLKMVSDLVDTAVARQRIEAEAAAEKDWKKGGWAVKSPVVTAPPMETKDTWTDAPSDDKDGKEDVKGRDVFDYDFNRERIFLEIAEAEIAAMRKSEEEAKAAATVSEKDDSDEELSRHVRISRHVYTPQCIVVLALSICKQTNVALPFVLY
ncbi:hypothetical protein BBJ28_00019984 [Nothophytophthora sp. Chile5]|nr:hypothetical protein BBJ28_00019984 [Nothophytophthora sp. Chile5]